MSSTPPAAPDPHYGDNHDGTAPSPASYLLAQGNQSTSPTTTPMTRTVAIIKTHALHHRFEIEKRIQEASFEIVKERQMEFDTETDPETLDELFGEDAASLAEGPVWVYVLERRRAVEVWNTLMGDRDPEVARQETPRSLRALYGISYARNGLMGSPDNHTAEIQIASLFVSSPPFSSTELPPEDNHTVTLEELSSSVYAALAGQGSEHTYAASDVTSPSTTAGGGGRRSSTHRASSTTSGGGPNKVPFKARPIPATIDKPDIVPRTTKAAALRAGIPLEKIQAVSAGPRAPVSKERLAQTFANVPGHKRTTTIAVASTAAPTIAPRMTRAASLRIGQPVESSSSVKAPALRQRSVTDGERNKHGAVATFEGVPGHKRRESIAVASTKAPTVAPRLNKSAALRAQKDKEAKEAAAKPPSSFKAPSKPGTGTLSRASSSGALSNPAPAPRPASQASTPKTRPSLAPTQPTATGHTRASSVLGTSSATTKLKPRPSSSMGTAPPSIAPRTNKSAALRAAKMEAEAAAAAEKAEKERLRKGGRAPPSSFKAIAI